MREENSIEDPVMVKSALEEEGEGEEEEEEEEEDMSLTVFIVEFVDSPMNTKEESEEEKKRVG